MEEALAHTGLQRQKEKDVQLDLLIETSETLRVRVNSQQFSKSCSPSEQTMKPTGEPSGA